MISITRSGDKFASTCSSCGVWEEGKAPPLLKPKRTTDTLFTLEITEGKVGFCLSLCRACLGGLGENAKHMVAHDHCRKTTYLP